MPVGRLIRKVRISDELPRLLNILKGDMTICGPRPERPEIAAQYEAAIPEFRLRLQAKAGLSWTEPIALRMEDDGRDTYTFFTHSQHSGKEMKCRFVKHFVQREIQRRRQVFLWGRARPRGA